MFVAVQRLLGVLLFFVFPAEEMTAKGNCLGIGSEMQITLFNVPVISTYKYLPFFAAFTFSTPLIWEVG